jgi:hypothetical protein
MRYLPPDPKGRPQKYERPLNGSAVEAVTVRIRKLCGRRRRCRRRRLFERIGWQRGRMILKERVVRELGPECLPVDPVSRTTYRPGEPAQCDLFCEADIPLAHW